MGENQGSNSGKPKASKVATSPIFNIPPDQLSNIGYGQPNTGTSLLASGFQLSATKWESMYLPSTEVDRLNHISPGLGIETIHEVHRESLRVYQLNDKSLDIDAAEIEAQRFSAEKDAQVKIAEIEERNKARRQFFILIGFLIALTMIGWMVTKDPKAFWLIVGQIVTLVGGFIKFNGK